MTATTVDILPEELLERILRYALAAPRGSLSVLLTSTKFHRIALPLYYREIDLKTADACLRLSALDPTSIRPHVLSISHSALYSPLLPTVLTTFAHSIQHLELIMEMPVSKKSWDDLTYVEDLCQSLASLDALRTFSLRKGPGAPFLLGAHWTRLFLGTLAQSIRGRWLHLESAHIAFKMSQMDVFVSLLSAFGELPSLRTLATEMPTIWNNILLDFAETNANDARILLLLPGVAFSHFTSAQHASSPKQAADIAAQHPALYIALSSVYMRYAQKHDRLMDALRIVSPTWTKQDTAWRGVKLGSSHTLPRSHNSLVSQLLAVQV